MNQKLKLNTDLQKTGSKSRSQKARDNCGKEKLPGTTWRRKLERNQIKNKKNPLLMTSDRSEHQLRTRNTKAPT